MHFGADAFSFQTTESLRKTETYPEKKLWDALKKTIQHPKKTIERHTPIVNIAQECPMNYLNSIFFFAVIFSQ